MNEVELTENYVSLNTDSIYAWHPFWFRKIRIASDFIIEELLKIRLLLLNLVIAQSSLLVSPNLEGFSFLCDLHDNL